uniref:Uncharacterized protein MANES_15G024700 n=1 Tax=Rhizophora mucronata TaxID=61149 RepID=A0A2P2QX60_RHIMU
MARTTQSLTGSKKITEWFLKCPIATILSTPRRAEGCAHLSRVHDSIISTNFIAKGRWRDRDFIS